MLDCRRVTTLRLRFPDSQPADLVLSTGVHAIGRDSNGLPALVDDPSHALAQFCVDRRGVWLQLRDGVRGMHVNGRPVRRMAMLRAGDAVYIDGVELLLLGDEPPSAQSLDAGGSQPDTRMVLRGVGGQHHGRCFTLDQPRRVGRAADCDIRIADRAFGDQHSVIAPYGDGAVLRALGSNAVTLVNGHEIRDALLRPGDQVVFDSQHRFVIESPKCGAGPAPLALDEDEDDDELSPTHPRALPVLPSSVRRIPWLLLAALMLSAALSLLLVYGER